MAPSLSHSLLLQSRWQLDRKRNRKGLKDLLLLSFALKKNGPLIISHNAPRTEASVICGYEKAQESDRQPPQLWGEEVKKKKNRERSSFFSTSLLPAAWSLCFCGKHLGSFIPARHPWGPLCPLRLQGLSVLQSGSLLLLWKRGAQACWLACLDHLKVPMHPFPCYARPLAHPRCPEAWLV